MTHIPPEDPDSIDESDLVNASLGSKDAAALGMPEPVVRSATAESYAPMLIMIFVACGAALGALARFLLAQWAAQRFGTDFPYGTLIINISGSFLLGLIYTLLLRANLAVAPLARAFLGVGLLGGYTTFSSFSYETSQLLLEGNILGALVNPLASVVGGILMCMLGIVVGNLVINAS